MELVAQLRRFTLLGAEKLSSWWRQSLWAKALLLLSALLVAVLVFALLNALITAFATPPLSGASLAPQPVAGVFADINGDGLVDYIVEAEVILNKGPLAP
jgi:hypothetical protein